jgi:hypothetical protein
MHLTLTNARKGRWVISPNYRVSHPLHFCAVGNVVAQRYDVFCADFEMHAIWQGYVEDPAAKDFVARKARTIALSKAWGSRHKTSDNQPYSWVWKSLGDSITELYCVAWQGLGHARKCQFEDFLWERKVWIVFSPMDVCTRNLWKKAEKGKFTGSEATTRFPRVSCFEKSTRSVPETWGLVYVVLAQSANCTRNGTRNRIPVQPRKAKRN